MKNTGTSFQVFDGIRFIMLTICTLAFSALFAQIDTITPQTLYPPIGVPKCPPPAFYSCDPANMSPQDLVACNRSIALTYAPDLRQFMSTCYDDSEGGDADRILKVNFDGNWDATDNWENVENLSIGGVFNYGTNAYPNAYYSVLWTDKFWIITYCFYYARDWSEDSFVCSEDEHENDMVKTMLIVKRPTSMNDDPASLLMGYEMSHHGSSDMANCVPGSKLDISCDLQSGQNGVHLGIWSTSGSHALHDTKEDGFNDPPWNPCRIRKVNKLIHYAPSETASAPKLCPSSGQCPLNCPSLFGELDLNDILATEHTEKYGLIDNFNPTQGLWAQRNNPLIFNQGVPFDEQHFVCTNGNGCQGPSTGPLEGDAFAAAPWKGGSGMNPIPHILATDLATYNCLCADHDADCHPTSFSDRNFIFNPYLCNYYLTPSYYPTAGLPITSSGIDVSILEKSSYKSPVGISDVTWEITTVPANAVTCQGCNIHGSEITLFSVQNPCQSAGTFTVHIKASFTTADCGEMLIERDLLITRPGPIVPANQLVITQQGPPPCPAGMSSAFYAVSPTNPNWTYAWTCMACEFTTDTHSSSVYAKKVSSYVPIYRVTVGNGCGTSTSQEFQLGECPPQLMPDVPGISIFPNPASGLVHLKLEGGAQDADCEVYVRDQFSGIRFHRQGCASQLDIDVSNWPPGTYYLTMIQPNHMLSKTFVVNHEGISSPASDPK